MLLQLYSGDVWAKREKQHPQLYRNRAIMSLLQGSCG